MLDQEHFWSHRQVGVAARIESHVIDATNLQVDRRRWLAVGVDRVCRRRARPNFLVDPHNRFVKRVTIVKIEFLLDSIYYLDY